MRPFRCSLRLGFHDTSKWNRFQQWACRFSPSRAASVAIKNRNECLFMGSALNARLIRSRSSIECGKSGGGPVVTDVVRQSADHDCVEQLLLDRHPSAEALGIENLQRTRLPAMLALASYCLPHDLQTTVAMEVAPVELDKTRAISR